MFTLKSWTSHLNIISSSLHGTSPSSQQSTMGGGVFLNAKAAGHSTIQIVRLNLEDYTKLKHGLIQRLSASFGPDNIINCAEAPGKTDFGDIDINISHDEITDWADVASTIGATAYLNRGSEKSQKCSFAMRLDGQPCSELPICYTLCKSNDPLRTPSELTEQAYIQLDLEVVSPDLNSWTAFYGSYGDLVGILGNAVTNFGFDVTDRGLRLRLQEADDSGRGEWEYFQLPLDEGRMMLSSDPKKVMEFFGLDVERYDSGFGSEVEIFEWLGKCRMVSELNLKRERNEASETKRKTARPMFARFFKEWLPQHLEEKKTGEGSPDELDVAHADDDQNSKDLASPADESPGDTGASTGPPAALAGPATDADNKSSTIRDLRAQYLTESLAFFNKHAEYSTLHDSLLHKRANSTVAQKFRTILAIHSQKKGPKLAELVRAFRRFVTYRTGQPVILDEANSDDDTELWTFLDASGRQLKDSDTVEKWIKEKFDDVKDRERERVEKEKKKKKKGPEAL